MVWEQLGVIGENKVLLAMTGYFYDPRTVLKLVHIYAAKYDGYNTAGVSQRCINAKST